MNICCFTGYLVENPRMSRVEGVALAEFPMVIYTYRKTKSGEKSRIPTYIWCEAWHTGAETLEKFASKGTKLNVYASARNISREDKELVFRINEFEFCNQDFED